MNGIEIFDYVEIVDPDELDNVKREISDIEYEWEDFKKYIHNLSYDNIALKASNIRRMFSSLGHVEFIFNEKNELLLQKRYSGKYHSPSLWTNTCCTHPNKNESTDSAAKRRLEEEMGFCCDLKEVFSFIYDSVLRGESEIDLSEFKIKDTDIFKILY